MGMSGDNEGASFIVEIVKKIRDAKELDDSEKDELVKMVEEAWESEQEY